MKTFTDVNEHFESCFEVWDKRGVDRQRSQELSNLEDTHALWVNVTSDAIKKGNQKIVNAENAILSNAAMHPTNLSKRRIQWACEQGHTYYMTIGAMETALEQGENLCRICARVSAKGQSDAVMNARLKFAMQHDERGEEMHLDNYVNANEAHTYDSRTTNEGYVTYSKNLHLWTRPWDVYRQDVWIAEDGQRAFLWVGTKPIVTNPAIKEMFDYAGPADAGGGHHNTGPVTIEPYYEPENLGKKGYTHRKGLENAIAECIENGAYVLNIGLNPQYISPGVYEWGNLYEEDAALAEWIDGLKQRWLDAVDGDRT